MKKYLVIIFLIIHSVVHSQEHHKPGVQFKCKKYYNNFALLLQDTVTNFNRYTNSFINSDYSDSRLFPAILIEKKTVIKVEEFIKSKMSPNETLRNFIRLYIGFKLLNSDSTFIVVQFLTKKEYFEKKSFYNFAQNLIARKSNDLRFAIFVINKERNIALMNQFPKNMNDW